MMKEALSDHNVRKTLAVVNAREGATERLSSGEPDIRGGHATGGISLANKAIDFTGEQKSYDFSGVTIGAGTRCGMLFFSVSGEQKKHAATDDIASALALSHWEPVIQYLEDHLDCQIDIDPDDGIQRATADQCVHLQFTADFAHCHKTASDRAEESINEHRESRLEVLIPVDMLMAVPAIPAVPIPEYHCKFADLSCTLILDRFCIAATRSGEIEPGAVVLLPSSFSAVWHGQLHANLVGPAITCEIAAQENRLRLVSNDLRPVVAGSDANGERSELAATASVTIRLKKPLRIPADLILGLAARSILEPVDIEPADASHSVDLHGLLDAAEVLIDGELYCEGHVAPMARGMGMRVDRMLHAI